MRWSSGSTLNVWRWAKNFKCILALMENTLEPADLRFRQIMNDAARRILNTDESPYDVGIQLMGDLGEVLTTADFSGGAYAMWGCLTDGIDGPPSYSRGLSEPEILQLMHLAAREWLDMDPTAENVRAYLSRWEDWPESVRRPRS